MKVEGQEKSEVNVECQEKSEVNVDGHENSARLRVRRKVR